MRIGIEINGVLRNTLGKIEQTYQKFMIDKTDGIEVEDDFEYKITYPINTLDLKNHFTFKDDEEIYSFLYEEFPMEIFGHSQSTEYSTFNVIGLVFPSMMGVNLNVVPLGIIIILSSPGFFAIAVTLETSAAPWLNGSIFEPIVSDAYFNQDGSPDSSVTEV